MKLEHCELENLKFNKANPRVIKDYKFHKLVKSILVLPKMLELRPIVVDNKMVVLGGNMRLKALQHISKMDDAEIYSVLSSSTDFKKKSDEEQQKLTTYWNAWVIHPKIPFIKATELTNAEMQEFIIKDNIGFGEWDWDMLANEWETTDLSEWGVDMPTWNTKEEDINLYVDKKLPEELQGIDLTPADLPKLQGTDEVEMERIIIVFKKEQSQKLANILGLESIDKVIYNLDELTK